MMTGMASRQYLCMITVLATLAVWPAGAAADSVGRAIGEARDLKSDELLYREIYCANGNPDEIEVIYRNDEDDMVARKLLDYSSGPTTPSFVQQNFYASEIIAVDLRADKVNMSVRDADNTEPKKSSSAKADGEIPVVIDAGFDQFVRDNWDGLLAGEKKKFLFPFAERDQLVKLRIKKSACSYPSETDQCFKLELSNWFIRLLVAPIELGYDPQLQRLLRYRGLSNIGDGKGNGSVVDISYDYRGIPELACSTTDPDLPASDQS